jgi:hypothetical protein
MFPLKLEGRVFLKEDVRLISSIVKANPNKTRADLSRIVCRELSWMHFDGRIKETRCRVAMLRMHESGLIELPQAKRNPQKKTGYAPTPATNPGEETILGVKDLLPIEIALVDSKNRTLSNMWNTYMDRYHYLGYRSTSGHQMRYMVSSGGKALALFNFSSPAWKIQSRDKWITWSHDTRERNLKYIINNSRFLILPWIKSKNLASWILGSIERRVQNDWQIRYGYRPVLMETFVDTTKFQGTCYQAANWSLLGMTQGRGKYDRSTKKELSIKKIFVRQLEKNWQTILIGV